MANEFRKVTDQNGVDHPVCDDTRVDWSSYAVLGADNILVNQVTNGTVSNVVVSSVDNDKIKLVGTSNNANNAIYSNQKVYAGSYKLSAVYTGTTSDNQRPSVIADLYNANGTVKTSNYVIVRPSSTSANVTVSGTDYLSNFRVYFANGDVIDMEIAIDLKLATDPSTGHVKGAMTNKELTENKYGLNKTLDTTDDLDNVKEKGIYIIKGKPINAPENASYAMMIVSPIYGDGSLPTIQTIFMGNNIYSRTYSGSPIKWNSWYKYTGTAV